MKIAWDDSLLIGVEVIDNGHKAILEEFTKLYEHMREGKGHELSNDLISFLGKYVDEHLPNEEAIMLEISYPEILEHKQHHQAFRDKVIEIKEEYHNTDITNSDLIKLNLMIKDWLINHIMTVDMKLGEYYNSL